MGNKTKKHNHLYHLYLFVTVLHSTIVAVSLSLWPPHWLNQPARPCPRSQMWPMPTSVVWPPGEKTSKSGREYGEWLMMRKISFIVICIFFYNVLDMYVSVYIYVYTQLRSNVHQWSLRPWKEKRQWIRGTKAKLSTRVHPARELIKKDSAVMVATIWDT